MTIPGDYEDANETFMHGACHLLARELSRLVRHCELCVMPGQGGHACVVHLGKAYDINGETSLDDMLADWDEYHMEPQMFANDQCGRDDFDEATCHFVQTIDSTEKLFVREWALWVRETFMEKSPVTA